MTVPDTGLLAVTVIGGCLGAAFVLLLVGLRGTVKDPTRPPSRIVAAFVRQRSSLTLVRAGLGILVAVLVGVVTRWPVAALGLGLLVAFWPALTGGSRIEKKQTAQLEAVVAWCESLRDTAAGHAGLEQAISVTAEHASAIIRPALSRLTGLLRSQVPLEHALADLAEQLDHSADLIVAALQMNVRMRGDGLVRVLTNLAVAGREELALRRKITASRAGDRRAMQLMILIVVAIASFLVLFSSTYTAPYRTVTGQLVLAVVLALFATSFVWIRKLAAPRPTMPFLPLPGHTTDPVEERILAELTKDRAAAEAAGARAPSRQRGASG